MPENTSINSLFNERAGIYSEFGKIICIGYGYFFSPEKDVMSFKVKAISGDDEKDLLSRFITDMNKFYKSRNGICFSGHNIQEFDIPFLCRRMLINGLKIPKYINFSGKKPWEVKLYDTFQMWKFGDWKNYTSLDLVAFCLDIPSPKKDIDGSMVRDVYYEEKNLDRIAEYCKLDVITVARILQRFNFLPLLEDKDIFEAE